MIKIVQQVANNRLSTVFVPNARYIVPPFNISFTLIRAVTMAALMLVLTLVVAAAAVVVKHVRAHELVIGICTRARKVFRRPVMETAA